MMWRGGEDGRVGRVGYRGDLCLHTKNILASLDQ